MGKGGGPWAVRCHIKAVRCHMKALIEYPGLAVVGTPTMPAPRRLDHIPYAIDGLHEQLERTFLSIPVKNHLLK